MHFSCHGSPLGSSHCSNLHDDCTDVAPPIAVFLRPIEPRHVPLPPPAPRLSSHGPRTPEVFFSAGFPLPVTPSPGRLPVRREGVVMVAPPFVLCFLPHQGGGSDDSRAAVPRPISLSVSLSLSPPHPPVTVLDWLRVVFTSRPRCQPSVTASLCFLFVCRFTIV